MYTRLLAMIGLGSMALASSLPGQDVAATTDEEKSIAAIAKLGGKAEIDSELPKATRLSVSFEAVSDVQLAALKKHVRIGALTTGDCKRATDRGIAGMAALPDLRKLTLSRSAATDRTAAAISECKGLRLLFVGDAKLTDAGLLALAKLPRLEVLDVTGNGAITDAGMAHVAKMERLEQLYVGGTKISDKGLEPLRVLEGLSRMNATGTKVTADGAERFEREMPNLRQVRR